MSADPIDRDWDTWQREFYSDEELSAAGMHWLLDPSRPASDRTDAAPHAADLTARGKAGRRARAKARDAVSEHHRDGRRLRTGELDAALYGPNGWRKPAR